MNQPLIPGVDFISFEATCYFSNKTMRIVKVTHGPPAQIGQAQLIFDILSQLSADQRTMMDAMDIKQLNGEPLAMMLGIHTAEDGGWYTFTSAMCVPNNDDYCPGCNCFLGGPLNPICTDSDGCEKYRRMNNSTPLEELG